MGKFAVLYGFIEKHSKRRSELVWTGFDNFGDKLSGPGDFLGCNDFSSLKISCAITGARKTFHEFYFLSMIQKEFWSLMFVLLNNSSRSIRSQYLFHR